MAFTTVLEASIWDGMFGFLGANANNQYDAMWANVVISDAAVVEAVAPWAGFGLPAGVCFDFNLLVAGTWRLSYNQIWEDAAAGGAGIRRSFMGLFLTASPFTQVLDSDLDLAGNPAGGTVLLNQQEVVTAAPTTTDTNWEHSASSFSIYPSTSSTLLLELWVPSPRPDPGPSSVRSYRYE